MSKSKQKQAPTPKAELNPEYYLFGSKDVTMLNKLRPLIRPDLWDRIERRLRKA